MYFILFKISARIQINPYKVKLGEPCQKVYEWFFISVGTVGQQIITYLIPLDTKQ